MLVSDIVNMLFSKEEAIKIEKDNKTIEFNHAKCLSEKVLKLEVKSIGTFNYIFTIITK